MTENDYDRVPYTSVAFDYTTPEFLATIATLFAVPCPDFRTARVLELGCASGGNIIPLAYCYPDTQIHGVDLSQKQIQEGQRYISDLGLNNIELTAMSIEDLDADFGEFDFIIAHGLHSWVTTDLQHRIIEICQANLAPDGIAYVSHNTLPGWNLVRSIRDLMMFHTKKVTDPQLKVQQARGVLQFMAAGFGDDMSPHAQALRTELEMLRDRRDDYLLHEHLEFSNNPVYFHEFMESAQRVGLQYLSDVELSTMSLNKLPESVRTQLQQLDNLVDIEQYIDFFLNRRFRRTLLRHDNFTINRQITIDDLKKLYYSTRAIPATELNNETIAEGVSIQFRMDHLNITSSNEITKGICAALIERGGKPVSYEDMCRMAADKLPGRSAEDIDYILGGSPILYDLIVNLLLQISLSEGNYTLEVSERPVTSRLARYIAEQHNTVPNLRHQMVVLNEVDSLILRGLDGTKTASELANELYDNHGVRANEADAAGRPESKQRSDLAEYCRQCAINFGRIALLES